MFRHVFRRFPRVFETPNIFRASSRWALCTPPFRSFLSYQPSAVLALPGSTVAFSSVTLSESAVHEDLNQYWKGRYLLKFYQYEVCPFCNKARAYMEYHKIPFKRIEVNPFTKEEAKFQDYKQVPFLLVEDVTNTDKEVVQVNGSQNIIDYLYMLGNGPSKTSEVSKLPGESKWAHWADDVLVHLLPPNIYRTPQESLQAFSYISECSNFSFAQKFTAKYIGAFAMFWVARMTKKKYGIEKPREELYDAVEKWISEGLSGKKFHGGIDPSCADIIIYGVLRSLRGLDTWKDLGKHTHPEFLRWFNDMEAETSL